MKRIILIILLTTMIIVVVLEKSNAHPHILEETFDGTLTPYLVVTSSGTGSFQP